MGRGYSYWWLRSPGDDDNYAAYVNGNGNVNDNGNNVNNSLGVRPAWPHCPMFAPGGASLRGYALCVHVVVHVHEAKESRSPLRGAIP